MEYQIPKQYRNAYLQLLSYANRYGWDLYDIEWGSFVSGGISFCFHKQWTDKYLETFAVSASFYIKCPNHRNSPRELERRFSR